MADNQDAWHDPSRYFLYALGVDVDIDAQFLAIRSLLWRNRAADAELDREIESLNDWAHRTGRQQAVDEGVDSMHASVFQEAAHSLGAVGMLAPLIESILYQTFRRIEGKYGAHLAIGVSRPARKGDEEKPWDCHWYCNRNRKWKKDLLQGTFQLVEAIGLRPSLPPSTDRTLAALFAYRNKNFHNGLEWPIEERRRFARSIEQEHWEAWFRSSRTGDEPWIFYMTPAFIDHCLAFAQELLDALGTFVLELATKHGDPDLGPPPDWMKDLPK
jgi:hypothetical protein